MTDARLTPQAPDYFVGKCLSCRFFVKEVRSNGAVFDMCKVEEKATNTRENWQCARYEYSTREDWQCARYEYELGAAE